jgi:hypothetical protein
MVWFYARTWRYQRIHYDHRSFLRDEEGLIDASKLDWTQVKYPSNENGGELIQLRPRKERVIAEGEQGAAE